MKNQELAAATREAEKLLREISDSTALAEKEKFKVAVIVEAVSKKVGGRLCCSLWRSGGAVLVCVAGRGPGIVQPSLLRRRRCLNLGGLHGSAPSCPRLPLILPLPLPHRCCSSRCCSSHCCSSHCCSPTAALPTALPQAEEIAAVKQDAERDLAEAKPALDAALAALNSITPKDIGALKALKNPPDVVKRIFDCVLVLRCARGGGRAAPVCV